MTIPIFMPEAACPHRCVFCDQVSITGQVNYPSDATIRSTVVNYLASRKKTVTHVEVGFFGGSFTGLPFHEMERVLDVVSPWIASGEVKAIRVSTRPDYIGTESLALLRAKGVQTIELGAQSFNDRVLEASERGHTAGETRIASSMILDAGFRLGHQLMVGLPAEEPGDEVRNAEESVRLGAVDIRIYPVLVLRGTPLAEQYLKGNFKPLALDEAVEKTVRMVRIFEAAGRNIIRIGLHPSEGFTRGDLLAGPWHPNFRDKVRESRI